MESVAREDNIPLADIVGAFSAYGKTHDTYLFVDPKLDCYHPNATGHGIVSDELARVMIGQGLLPVRPSGSAASVPAGGMQ
jgi:lysophospholipase L1-like esterase